MNAEQINHALAIILCAFGVISVFVGMLLYMFFREPWQLLGFPIGLFFLFVSAWADN